MSSLFSLLVSLAFAWSASALTIDWVPIGNPGNACKIDTGGCFGSVAYDYQISKYEITNAQYVEFLNAVAMTDSYRLYDPGMSNSTTPYYAGGIVQSGSPGSYTYSTIPGRDLMPVNFISFHSALRFANWLQNGQPTGPQGPSTTEDGSYTLLGSNSQYVTRNSSAIIALASEDEWYKAAYYDPVTTSYFSYPAGSSSRTNCTAPTAAPNSANCDDLSGADAVDADVDDLTPVGSFPGSPSPYGTYDQGGNVDEWNEAVIGFNSDFRGRRGGSFYPSVGPTALRSSSRGDGLVSGPFAYGYSFNGFRPVMIPEPSTGLLVIAGLLGLAGWRRGRP